MAPVIVLGMIFSVGALAEYPRYSLFGFRVARSLDESDPQEQQQP